MDSPNGCLDWDAVAMPQLQIQIGRAPLKQGQVPPKGIPSYTTHIRSVPPSTVLHKTKHYWKFPVQSAGLHGAL